MIDDLHELGPAEAQRQLELLMMRAPEERRFVLATRHDVRLGLHRLRLEGELAEIREPDLRFTVAEAEELFNAAGVKLPDPALLVERTEGWAAGVRLAALSLAGHPDPGRFAEKFSGTERTVAEYLLVRILALCPGPVATGFFAGLGDPAATSSIIYKRTVDPADVVRTGLRGFDHDAMTIIPGLRTRLLAQGHRFLPRTVMARMTAKMLAPDEQHTTTDPKHAATPPASDARG